VTLLTLMAAWVVVSYLAMAVTTAVWIVVKAGAWNRAGQDEALEWVKTTPAFVGVRALTRWSALVLAVLVLVERP
jgi:hypothetical protein